jgi:hypothetical protein
MAIFDSTNVGPPDFGPSEPNYPRVEELIHVTSPAVVGTKPAIYPGFIVQVKDPSTYRDRVPCYLVEPNSIALGPGYYDARLVSEYNQLPLFAATCCPVGPFSSSSSSSAAGR